MAKNFVMCVLKLVVLSVVAGPIAFLSFALAVLYVPPMLELLGFGSEGAYHRAVQEERAGNLHEALKWCNEAIRRNPSRPDYYVLRGELHERLGDYRRAVDDYTVALVLRGYNSSGLRDRGRAYERLGDLYLAASDYCESLLSHPPAVGFGLIAAAEERVRPGCSGSEAVHEWTKFFEKAVAEYPENECFKKALDFLREAETQLKRDKL